MFNVPEGGNLGFGTTTTVDGLTINVGTSRYPYTAWCLESIDFIRPGPGEIYGEDPGSTAAFRTRACDVMAKSVVDDAFLSDYPSAGADVITLQPTRERGTDFSTYLGEYQLDREEFYNRNLSARRVTLSPRPCQTVMYRLRARRDEGYVQYPGTNCVPTNQAVSPLNLAPVGIVSTVYSASKPLTGSEDFLWGFNPLAFEPLSVRRAISWILRERWEIAAQP